MSDVFPSLRYRDVDAALTWLTTVLGFREIVVFRDDAGRVVHAELGWGDGAVLVGPDRTDPAGDPATGPDHGTVYLATAADELRAGYDRLVAAGVSVLDPLSDKGYGLTFTVEDPAGKRWSVGDYRPAPPAGIPGWLEIGVPEPGPTAAFFTALFGWTAHPMAHGNANVTGPGLRAGLHGHDEDRSIVVYFAVPDLDAAVARVRELGGTAADAGPDQPGFGRFSSATDPQGVAFGLHQPPPTGG